MEHIDEGTIHAWLDGALPALEGARVEAHAATCATCSAAIAEARGLIAASSRILAALDDVPSGVIPKRVGDETAARPPVASRTPSPPLEQATPGAPARGRRPWWQRPQLAAAAGMAFVAVALSVFWQRSSRSSIAEMASDAASEPAMAPAASPATAASAVESAALPAATSDTTRLAVPSAARTGARPAAAKLAADAAKTDEPSTAATNAPTMTANADAAAPQREERARKEMVARDAAGQSAEAKRVDAPVPAPSIVGASTSAAKARAANELVATPRAGQVAATQGATQGADATDSMAKKVVPARLADAIVRQEGERVRGETDVARRSAPASAPAAAPAPPASQAPVAGGAAKSAVANAALRGAPLGAPTPGGLAGCYQLQLSAAAREAGLGDAIELVASGAGEDEARPAYLVRALSPATTKTASAWRWTIVPAGVSLVRGVGSGASRFVMVVASGEGRARPDGALAATRIDCTPR